MRQHHLENALKEENGIIKAEVNFAASTAEISYDPNKITPSSIRQAIAGVGYSAVEPRDNSSDAVEKEEAEKEVEYRTLMKKFWLAAIVSICHSWSLVNSTESSLPDLFSFR